MSDQRVLAVQDTFRVGDNMGLILSRFMVVAFPGVHLKLNLSPQPLRSPK